MIIMQVYAFTYKIKNYEIFCFHPTICKKKYVYIKTGNSYIMGSEKCVSIIVGIAVKRSINTFLDIDY